MLALSLCHDLGHALKKNADIVVKNKSNVVFNMVCTLINNNVHHHSGHNSSLN